MIDVLVVGGGPAGLVTALHAARAGLEAVVLEPRAAPVDKACGEGLMPGAVAALSALGVDPAGSPVRGIRYTDGRRSAAATFRRGTGRGVRRTVLYDALLRAAVGAGVQLVPQRVRSVVQGDGWVEAAGHRGRYLVAADGLHSPVRRAVGLDRPATTGRRWGVRAHFATEPWTDLVEVHWAGASEAYVTPIGPGCIGVAVLGGSQAPYAQLLASFPQLAARLPTAPAGEVRAAGPLRQHASRRVAGRVLLVGDAAGYVDALTGEGLALAFASARALVARVVEGRPERYEHDYRRISRSYRLLTTSLLWAAGQTGIRPRIVPAAAALPPVFRLAVNALA